MPHERRPAALRTALSIRLSQAQRVVLEALAEEYGESVSESLRRVLNEWINEHVDGLRIEPWDEAAHLDQLALTQRQLREAQR